MIIKTDMKNESNTAATYTLWVDGDLQCTYPHTREGSDDAFAEAFEYHGCKVEIFSSRDDLVWSNVSDEPCEPSDAWHDADALASAGMGTDEDYGCWE